MNLGVGGATTLSASLNGGAFVDVLVDATGTLPYQRFLGLIDSDGFSSVTLSNTATNLAGLDRVQYGTAAIPEPGTAWLLAAGLGVLGVRRRARGR